MMCGSYQMGETGLAGQFSGGNRRGMVDGIDVVECDLAYSNADKFIRRSTTFLRYMLHTIRLAFTEEYDVIFATTTPLTAAVPGILARWIRRKPFVFEVRDLWPELPRAMGVIRNPVILGMLSALEWCSYKSANRMIGLAPGIVDGIKRFGAGDDKVSLIPNGCDIEVFKIDGIGSRPQKVNANHLLAVYAGTHGIANGLNSVLDAAVELKRRGRTDIKLALVGSGKEKEKLMARATCCELDSVIFLDSMPKHQLAELFANADIGIQSLANVSAFYFGTSPNKFFDYISAGLPVLCNYPGWLSEMIQQQRCGFVVAPDDPASFVDALELAASNKKALSTMGTNARKLALKEFDRNILANKWVDWVTGAVLPNTRTDL